MSFSPKGPWPWLEIVLVVTAAEVWGAGVATGIQCLEARDAETSYTTQDNLLHKELSIPKYQ